jgi:hypothetical protein
MLPLGCFPLWGREGVILQAAAENKRIEKKEDFNRAIFYKTPKCFHILRLLNCKKESFWIENHHRIWLFLGERFPRAFVQGGKIKN